MYKLILYLVGIYYLVSFFFVSNISDSYLLPNILLFLCCIVLYIVHGLNHERQLFSNWTRPTYLLLLGLVVVNFQTILNVAVNLAPISTYLRSNLYNGYTYKVLSLSIVCMIGLLLGGLRYVKPFKALDVKPDVSKQELLFWSFLSLIFLALFIINIDINGFISGASYQGSGAADRKTDVSSYFEQLLTCSIIITLALHSKLLAIQEGSVSFKKFLSRMPKVFLVTATLYIIIRLLSGDRGPVIYTACTFIYAYLIISNKKLSFIKVITVVIIAASFITIVGIARDLDMNLSFWDRVLTASKITESTDKLPSVLSPTQELGNSIICNYISVRDIDQDFTFYRMGEYNLFAILGSLPGSSFILSNVLGINLRDKMSSEYITSSFFGKDYPLGLGTTAVSDFYLDFGIFGCFLLFYICGAMYKKIDMLFVRGGSKMISIFWYIAIIKICSLSIYTSRFSFAGTISAALYVLVVYWLVKVLLFRNK